MVIAEGDLGGRGKVELTLEALAVEGEPCRLRERVEGAALSEVTLHRV